MAPATAIIERTRIGKSPWKMAIGGLVAAIPRQVRLCANIRPPPADLFDIVMRQDETRKKFSAPMFPDGFAKGLEAARQPVCRSRCGDLVVAVASGKRKLIVVPRPGAEEMTSSPPCAAMISRTIDRPRPAPSPALLPV